MRRTFSRLTATGVANVKKKGRYADGGGLYLRVSPALNKSWVFRWIRNGRATEIGLGRFPDVSLSSARKFALDARSDLAEGRNPKTEREKRQSAGKTLGMVADEFLEAMSSRWNNRYTRSQWKRSLSKIIAPIRNRQISEVDTSDVLQILSPIWKSKPSTASKTRMRIEQVLDYAKSKGWRTGENPARWRGHLSNILPRIPSLINGHYFAMTYQKVPGFLKRLATIEAMSARVLEFQIMTAVRPSEARLATWDEMDLPNALWVIPAHRMKADREHRVPLSAAANEMLEKLSETRTSKYVFPGVIRGQPMSATVVNQLMYRLGETGVHPHGFRSSFRDWAGDCTSFPREIAEAALAHKVGDSTEQAYRRGDALEKRRKLMEAWGDYCSDVGNQKVVNLHA